MIRICGLKYVNIMHFLREILFWRSSNCSFLLFNLWSHFNRIWLA